MNIIRDAIDQSLADTLERGDALNRVGQILSHAAAHAAVNALEANPEVGSLLTHAVAALDAIGWDLDEAREALTSALSKPDEDGVWGYLDRALAFEMEHLDSNKARITVLTKYLAAYKALNDWETKHSPANGAALTKAFAGLGWDPLETELLMERTYDM